MKATITVEQSKELQNKWGCKNDKQIEDGFIGIDGKHHDYEYDEEKYLWHSHMTNEEWKTMNDQEGLKNCQKCPMWEHCKKNEHTVIRQKDVKNKLVDDLSKSINKRILEDMEASGMFDKYKKRQTK